MTHDFTNKAILCSTWQQMLHLADLAREQGYKTDRYSFNEELFDNGEMYFMVFDEGYFCDYHDYIGDFAETTYADFITPTTFINPPVDDSVYGC
jgi:hypothetical protein